MSAALMSPPVRTVGEASISGAWQVTWAATTLGRPEGEVKGFSPCGAAPRSAAPPSR